jgi:glycosyltransferase involved in cell wall biosynthesis
MKKIRVVMLITAYYPALGGAERQLGILAPRLQAQDIDVHVVTRSVPGLPSYEEVNGVPVHRVTVARSKALGSVTFTANAVRKIGELKPDVIHAHSLMSPSTTALMAKRLYGIPVVTKLLRGGKVGDLDKVGSRRIGAARIPYMMRNINGFIVISQQIDEELAERGVPEERRHYVPNGVDIDRFNPLTQAEKDKLKAELGLPPGPSGIYMGRLIPIKRVDQLIGVWPKIREQHADANLLVLGSGVEEDKLKAMAGPGVHMLGTKDDVVPYLQVADFFVLPSSTEGLSNAMLEAMAIGLPSIVTRVGGATDLIKPGKTGWLIEPDNWDELEDRILHVLNHLDEAQKVGQAARERIIQDYTLDAVARRLRQVYDGLL